jgi:hypothetical protein
MAYFFKSFLNLFLNFFKVIEENQQLNIIRHIGKNDRGETIVLLSPISSNNTHQMFPHDIITQPLLKNQLRKPDIKLLEAVITCEGDIFFESIEYEDEREFLHLRSVLTNEHWRLCNNELLETPDIFNRINIRFKTTHINCN